MESDDVPVHDLLGDADGPAAGAGVKPGSDEFRAVVPAPGRPAPPEAVLGGNRFGARDRRPGGLLHLQSDDGTEPDLGGTSRGARRLVDDHGRWGAGSLGESQPSGPPSPTPICSPA